MDFDPKWILTRQEQQAQEEEGLSAQKSADNSMFWFVYNVLSQYKVGILIIW